MNTKFRMNDYSTNIIISTKIGSYTPYKGYKMAQANLSYKKIQPSNAKIFDRHKKNQRILSRNDRIDLFLEGGQLSEVRKEEPNHVYNDRNFYKIIRNKKKSQIFSSLRQGRIANPNDNIHTKSTNVDSNAFLTKTDSMQLNDQFETLNEPTSPLVKQGNKSSIKTVSKMAIIPREVKSIRNASTEKDRTAISISTKRKNRTIRTQQKNSTNHQSQKIKNNVQSQPRPTQLQRSRKPLYYLDPKEISHIKADSYIVTEYPTGQIIFGNFFKKNAEIASLTKIMTFYAIWDISQTFNKNLFEEKIQIDQEAQAMTGTSAEIFVGDIYTVQQLLYGLMLPSGNDAATALAKWGGNLLQQNNGEPIDEGKSVNYVKIFVKHMNTIAKKLKMYSSRFMNPHGLPNAQSGSNPQEMAILTHECLKIPLFKAVINTKKYSCWVEHNGVKHEVVWQNTNKLLRRPDFIGGKTGVTITAGPCLASCYQLNDKILIVILLRTTKLSRRFKQTRFILGLALSKMNKIGYAQRIKEVLRNDAELDSDNSEDEEAFNYDRNDAKEMSKRNKILTFQM